MRPSIAAAPSGEKTHSDDSDDDNAEPEIISHIKYKIGAVYWRHGFSLPENGRIKLSNDELSFKGILGTKLSFDLKDVDIEKASRLGGLIHDAFIISVENSKEEGKEFTFSTGLKDTKKVIDKIQSAIANAKQDESHEKSRVWGPDDLKKDNQFRVPAPDPTLEKMKIIAERRLKGVDLQDYYKVAWSDEKPIYEPFLKGQGKNNVNVAHWETGKFEGDWCGETYTEKRIVSFDFMKQTIGQSLVEVKHTQHCRRTDNEQCIVQIKMEMKGFPYADCFVVEVRHVASCVGRNDLKIQIGMHVKFLKSCMFEKKIRTNTGAETTNAQLALLEMTLKGCAPYAKSAAKKERFRMPPDTTLTEMTIIGERKLKGVSIQDYREVAWSDKTPMYAPFLEQQGKNNVNVLPWEIGEFKGDWCGETYKEKRIVSFDFMKQTIGQTLVEVKHTQQLRRQDNDQCIVQIKMEMKGEDPQCNTHVRCWLDFDY